MATEKKWFVFCGDSDPEFVTPDTKGAEERVIEYLLDPGSDFRLNGYEFDEIHVIRGETYEVIPPKDRHQLRKIGD